MDYTRVKQGSHDLQVQSESDHWILLNQAMINCLLSEEAILNVIIDYVNFLDPNPLPPQPTASDITSR